jgi:hypothetical protein
LTFCWAARWATSQKKNSEERGLAVSWTLVSMLFRGDRYGLIVLRPQVAEDPQVLKSMLLTAGASF